MDRDYKIVVTNQNDGKNRTVFFSAFALQQLLGYLTEEGRFGQRVATEEEQLDAALAQSELIRALSDLSKPRPRPSDRVADYFIGDSDLSF